MIHIKKFFIGFISLLFLGEVSHSQDLLNYPNSIKYANYLYETQQYQLSSVEFERVLYLEPSDSLAKLKLIRSYRYIEDYSTAIRKIKSLFPGSLNDLPAPFSEEYMKLLINLHQYPEASEFLKKAINLSPEREAVYNLGLLTLQHQWPEAGRYSAAHHKAHAGSKQFLDLHYLSMEGAATKYKSPVLATSLSILLPGAGKLYTKNWKDAIYSFLFVSASSWLTYKSYVNNGLGFSSVMLGTITLSLYSANIYGSYKSAASFNKKRNQKFSSDAEEILLNDQRIFLY